MRNHKTKKTQIPSTTSINLGGNSSSPELDYIKQKGGDISTPLLERYSYRITDQIKKTIHGSVDNDPVAKQYIPQKDELKILPEELLDPIGDYAHTPVKGIVHRHPDRVLFKPANVCAVYCRYCFRREMIGPGSDILSAQERENALNYIREHPEIWEVILTGGDPLILAPRQLNDLMRDIANVQHVQVLRLHTRIPIAAPEKITDALCKTLQQDKPVYMALHINHINEITPEIEAAIAKLVQAGCILLSQSVLLKNINDNANALEQLFRKLITLRVKPYYIHHPDLAPGTSHFRLPIKEGQRIMRELQGRLSGLCQPQYMLDIPGGAGKVPINAHYIEELKNGDIIVESSDGNKHTYRVET